MYLDEALVFVFAIFFGSFVNVCIYRLPRDESLFFPRSNCFKCGGIIPFRDNVPVLSYLWLRGRCRLCDFRIPIRYPLVELTTAVLVTLLFMRHGLTVAFFSDAAFTVAMIILILVDYDHKILPDEITLSGIVVGLIVEGFVLHRIGWIDSVVGILVGAGSLGLVALTYYLLRKVEGLGLGDIKMLGMIGAFFGWQKTFLTLTAGSLLGSLVGVGMMAVKGKDLKYALPLGTFLGIAAIAVVFFGDAVIEWYLAFARPQDANI